MNDIEFESYKQRVRRSCPRGINYFCDGTPNGKPRTALGKCKFRQQGKCLYLMRAEDIK